MTSPAHNLNRRPVTATRRAVQAVTSGNVIALDEWLAKPRPRRTRNGVFFVTRSAHLNAA